MRFEGCCQDCYAYDPEFNYCYVREGYMAPGCVCDAFDLPAPDE